MQHENFPYSLPAIYKLYTLQRNNWCLKTMNAIYTPRTLPGFAELGLSLWPTGPLRQGWSGLCRLPPPPAHWCRSPLSEPPTWVVDFPHSQWIHPKVKADTIFNCVPPKVCKFFSHYTIALLHVHYTHILIHIITLKHFLLTFNLC